MPTDDESDDATDGAPGDLPEDLVEFTHPLPQDDRLWRHPSEMSMGPPDDPRTREGTPLRAASTGRPRRGPRRGLADLRLWLVAGTSALAGAVLTLAILSLGGTFEADQGPSHSAGEVKITVPDNPGESEIALTQALAPSVASVSATGPMAAHRGTALVLRADGHLVTTADTVDGAQEITVTFADGSAAPATVVGVDDEDDLAVIKVDRADLTPVPIGDVDDVQLGARATVLSTVDMASGSSTVAVGLVSGLDEQVHPRSGASMHGLIQTNIRLSAAESGAPLVNSKGEVIGLITKRGPADDVPEPDGTAEATPDPSDSPVTPVTPVTQAAAEQGVTTRFAVSIDWVQDVAHDLISQGRVEQVWLGIRGGELSTTQATTMGHDGALVTEVAQESPAAHAGIETGDVIVAVDGEEVDSMSDLIVCLRRHDPGDAVSVDLLRTGVPTSMTITLAPRSDDAN